MDNKNVNIQFPTCSTLLGIAFIILKLCHVIEWSWLWVLAPFWMGFAIWLVLFITVLIIAFIASR